MRILLVGGLNYPLGTELACRLAGAQGVTHVAAWCLDPVRDPDRLREAGVEIAYTPPAPWPVPGIRGARKLPHARRSLKRLASMEYDVASVQYLHPQLGLLARSLRRVAPRLMTTMWGSDLLRTGKIGRALQNRLVSRADVITAASPEMLEATRDAFGSSVEDRLHELRFGLTTLDTMRALNWSKAAAREELDLPSEGPVIALAYNGGEANRHLPVLGQLERVSLPTDTTILVPITYGGTPAYRARVREAAERSPLRCVVLEQYLSTERIAALRVATDVLIQVPTTDAFSGSMSEHLYAGNRVVTGAWLPYNWLADHGIELDMVDRLEDTGTAVRRAIDELDEAPEDLIARQQAIWNLVSWEKNLPNWLHVLRG